MNILSVTKLQRDKKNQTEWTSTKTQNRTNKKNQIHEKE